MIKFRRILALTVAVLVIVPWLVHSLAPTSNMFGMILPLLFSLLLLCRCQKAHLL